MYTAFFFLLITCTEKNYSKLSKLKSEPNIFSFRLELGIKNQKEKNKDHFGISDWSILIDDITISWIPINSYTNYLINGSKYYDFISIFWALCL